ncbi:MAG: hypothetical protein EHM39_07030, partial [Chloroflexi bacterium]
MTAILNVLETILERYNGRQRDALLPVLWDIQTAFGSINADAVQAISHTLHVPASDIYGVISFYSLFDEEPTGETIIRVCGDPSCGLAGADEILHKLCDHLRIEPGETTPDGRFTVEHSTCLGLCEHAPAALISRRGVGEQSAAPVRDPLRLLDGDTVPHGAVLGGDPQMFLTGLDGQRVQPLNEYGEYRALRRALIELSPETVITEVEASGLVGRGGAGFPSGRNWRFTLGAPGQPHYVICNADES